MALPSFTMRQLLEAGDVAGRAAHPQGHPRHRGRAGDLSSARPLRRAGRRFTLRFTAPDGIKPRKFTRGLAAAGAHSPAVPLRCPVLGPDGARGGSTGEGTPSMALPSFTMRQLLEAGVHFGHNTRRWNPKMAPYLFGVRKSIHIIDLQQTVPLLHRAMAAVRDTVAAYCARSARRLRGAGAW